MTTQAAARRGEPTLLTKDGNVFVWLGGYETRHLPKEAGFRWDALKKRWWTTDATRAAALADYGTAEAREAVGAKAADLEETFAGSRATDAQIEVPVPAGLALFPFQRAGVAFIERKLSGDAGRVILGDEMGCVDGEAMVAVNRGGKGLRVRLRDMYRRFHGFDSPRNWNPEIPTYCRALCDGELRQHRVTDVIDKGVRDTVLVTLASGKSVCLTPDHEIATPFGFRPAETLRPEHQVLTNGQPACPSDHHRVPVVDRVVSVEPAGPRRVYDIVMADPHRNFVADRVVVHNCGKTPQAICSVNALPQISKVLVICPASLKLNWMREWQRWTTRDLSVSIASTQHCADTDVVVVNYDCFSRKSKTAARLKARQWDLMICDEVHALKNPRAIRTKEILGRIERGAGRVGGIIAKHALVLSGTPIVNRPVELWPILSYLDPQTWRSWKYFVERFCAGYQDGWGWKGDGASHLEELQRKLRSTLMIRRLKSEVLAELPPKTRQIIEVPLEDMDDDVREAVEVEAREWDKREARMADLRADVATAEQGTVAYEEAVARLNDAVRVAFAEISKLRHATAVAKVPAVVEHVRQILEDGDQPLIIFVHHHDVCDGIRAALEPDHTVVVLTGRESQEQKQAAVDAFQALQARVFIGSITAAGVGITLTAASHVVFAELDWVPGSITQAESRCHRIGTKAAVLVQHVVLDGSLDARMAKTLIAKQAVLDAALGTGP